MMQIIKSLTKIIVFLFPIFAGAQSTFISTGDQSYQLLNRIDIKQQKNYNLILSTDKPISRKTAVEVAQSVQQLNLQNPNNISSSLSKIDKYDLQNLLINNIEWVTGDSVFAMSRKPVLKTFYKEKANFFQVNEKDFFLAVNPVIQENQSRENNNSATLFLNSKGLQLRGRISGKLGFDAYLTDNQERGPKYFQDRVSNTGFRAVPGAGYFKSFKTAIRNGEAQFSQESLLLLAM